MPLSSSSFTYLPNYNQRNNDNDMLLFFYLCFTACQDYFTHFEPSQSVGGAKTGDPQEKPPDHPQAELGLSHIWPCIIMAMKIQYLFQ